MTLYNEVLDLPINLARKLLNTIKNSNKLGLVENGFFTLLFFKKCGFCFTRAEITVVGFCVV